MKDRPRSSEGGMKEQRKRKRKPSHSGLDCFINCSVATFYVKYQPSCGIQCMFGRAVNLSVTWIKPIPILNIPQEMKEEEEDVPLRLVSLIVFSILTTDGGGRQKKPKGYQMKN